MWWLRTTCRSKGPKGEWIERTNDEVIASGSLKGNILQMEVVEDFESRPHEAVNGTSRKKLSKVLLGYSGGRWPGRSTKEKAEKKER